MKNNDSLTTKLIMAGLTLALVVYFSAQAYFYFTDPLSTMLSYTYQVEEELDLSGYVVREEQLLSGDTSGLLRIDRAEGERVSTNGVIATVYADQASIDRQAKMESLTTRIEQLQYAQEAELGADASLKLDNQILQHLRTYRSSVTANRLYDAEKTGSELRAMILKRDYTHSDMDNLAVQIADLQEQVQTLRSQTIGSIRTINAPVSGLYSTVVDGYETALTPDSIQNMKPSQFYALKPTYATQSGLGKLVLGANWYYIAVMPKEEAESLQKDGLALYLRFAKGVERDLAVSIASVSAQENGHCLVVFQGDTYLQDLTLLRRQRAQVIYHTAEGIRVPKNTLRILTKKTENEDGAIQTTQTLGVYCVVGMEARFKPIEVLYSGDSFVLVRATAPSDQESRRLRPGDEVIISANDLYDGKILG